MPRNYGKPGDRCHLCLRDLLPTEWRRYLGGGVVRCKACCEARKKINRAPRLFRGRDLLGTGRKERIIRDPRGL